TQIDWNVSDISLTYLGARYVTNTDNVFKAAVTIDEDSSTRVWTHELRVGNASGDTALKWLLGAYLLDQDGYANSEVQSGAFTSLTRNPEVTVRAKAVFGQATLPLTKSIRATAGLRYSD